MLMFLNILLPEHSESNEFDALFHEILLRFLASTSEKIEILRRMCYFSHSKCLNWWTRMKLRKVSSFSLPILL